MTEETPFVDRRTGETFDLSSAHEWRRALEAQQGDISALLDDVHDLADAVAGLADQLDNRRLGEPAGGTTPWCWRDLSATDAEVLWRELGEWVGWLRSRYPIAEQLPPCWAEHSELVEELTALHVVWNAAYRDPQAHATASAEFHDRWLPGVLARVKAWGVYCGAEHRHRVPHVYAGREALPNTA